MRRFRSAGVAMLAAAVWGVQAQARVTGQVVEFGEVQISPGGPGRPPLPGEVTMGREITTVYWERYLNHSDHVEAALCRAFGMTFQLDAGPGEGLPRQVLSRALHPRFTRPDGATSVEDATFLEVSGGSGRALFVFDDPWEMQPGAWEFAVYEGDALIVSKTFTVTVRPGPPQSVCARAVS